MVSAGQKFKWSKCKYPKLGIIVDVKLSWIEVNGVRKGAYTLSACKSITECGIGYTSKNGAISPKIYNCPLNENLPRFILSNTESFR